jgi:hypothetical protein
MRVEQVYICLGGLKEKLVDYVVAMGGIARLKWLENSWRRAGLLCVSIDLKLTS